MTVGSVLIVCGVDGVVLVPGQAMNERLPAAA
jgi:hypothetical protein